MESSAMKQDFEMFWLELIFKFVFERGDFLFLVNMNLDVPDIFMQWYEFNIHFDFDTKSKNLWINLTGNFFVFVLIL